MATPVVGPCGHAVKTLWPINGFLTRRITIMQFDTCLCTASAAAYVSQLWEVCCRYALSVLSQECCWHRYTCDCSSENGQSQACSTSSGADTSWLSSMGSCAQSRHRFRDSRTRVPRRRRYLHGICEGKQVGSAKMGINNSPVRVILARLHVPNQSSTPCLLNVLYLSLLAML